MSLTVHAYTRGESGKMIFLGADYSEELAGFESFRTTFYGDQTARSLGLQLLPSLANADLYVEGNDLARLKTEAEQVLQNIDLFTNEMAKDSEDLRFNIQNIPNAIKRAERINGGMVIW